MASLTGVAFALRMENELLLAFLIPLDVFLLSLFANLSNDYFDHKSGADTDRFMEKDPEFREAAYKIMGKKVYWEGNAFDLKFISEREGLTLMTALAAGAVAVAIPILWARGVEVLVLGGIGLFISFFYTAPPLNLGAKGYGEMCVFLSFMFMSFFSYWVIVEEFSATMLLISITVGIGVTMMRLVDEMNGYDIHVSHGEKDLAVRFGLEGAIAIVRVLIVVLYVVVIALAVLNWTYALMMLTAPVAYKITKILADKKDKFRFVRPIFNTFMLAAGNEAMIIIALTAQTALTYL